MGSLSGAKWEFAWCPHGQCQDPRTASRLPFFPARVPGCNIEDLLRLGVIPDPFKDAGFRGTYWVELEDFWYRSTFSADDGVERRDPCLAFEGLDTFAVIWLNGKQIGETQNMFRPFRFPVGGVLGPGANELYVLLRSPVRWAAHLARQWGVDPAELSAAFNTTERLVARKMQMSYGWDNHPRIVASGIYRDVAVLEGGGPAIRDAWIRTATLAEDFSRALLEGGLTVSGAGGLAEPRLRIEGSCGTHRFGHEAPLALDASGSARATFEASSPALWWPNGHGPQSLYDTRVQVLDGGLPVATECLRVGIRAIRVITGPPRKLRVGYRVGSPGGEAPALDGGDAGPWSHVPLPREEEVDAAPLLFEVNGRRIPIVGANWQPCDAVYTRATDDRRRALLREAREMGLTMVRVWGGGYVESPAFYETCSEFGLLVWQDFPFASALYPLARPFLEEVEAEARDIVVALRSHACLAAWCGDNESDMGYHDRGRDPATNLVNHEILPRVVGSLDPGRYYHPSSPYGTQYPRSPWSGDNRNWGPFHPAGNYLHIRREESRFVSEGGAYALPSLEAMRAAASEASLWPPNNWIWNLHGGSTDTYFRDFSEMSVRMWEQFSPLQGPRQAVEVSQFALAWGAMVLVTHCRRRWPETGGVLWWKLDDCWPCMDGGIIDYTLARRTSFYAIRYAASPRLLCFFQPPEGTSVELHLINHTEAALTCSGLAGIWCARSGTGVEERPFSVEAAPWSTTFVTTIGDTAHDEAETTVYRARALSPDGSGVREGLWTLGPPAAWCCYARTDWLHRAWGIPEGKEVHEKRQRP